MRKIRRLVVAAKKFLSLACIVLIQADNLEWVSIGNRNKPHQEASKVSRGKRAQ
jgi:hypothetical protein